LSKTYEALIKAEQLRAAQDPAALARRVARATEEGEALRAEFRACQEQLAALVERVDAADTIDPATIDDLGRQVARLAAQQERLAAEPRQLVEAAVQQFKEELDRRWAGVQSQSDQATGLSLRLEEAQAGLRESVASVSDRVEHAETIRGADADRVQADVQRLRESLELLRTSLAESERTSAAVNSAQVETLRADLDALRQRLAAADDEHRQRQRLGEEKLDRRLQDMLGKLESLLTGQTHSASEMDALRARVAALADAQVRQQHLAEDVRRAQASAENAQSLITAIDGAQASNAEMFRRQMEELRRNLLENVDSVQASLAGPLKSVGEVAELRAQVGALAEVQARQQQLAEEVRRAQAGAEEAQSRLTAIDGAQASNAETLRQQIEELRGSLLEKVSSVQASLAGPTGEIEELRAQVGALAEVQAQQQRQLAESVARAQASAEEAQSRITAIDGAQASNAEASHGQMEKLRRSLLEKVSSLRFELDAAQSSLAEQSALAAGVEALRTQMAPLVEAQARQSELEDLVSGARSAADEVGRRIAAHEEAQGSTLAALRQQIEALQVESGAWRDIDAAAQSALARHEDTAGAIDELRTQVSQMVEAQVRQQQLFEDLLVAPANADDPRPTDAAFKGSADLANLRRQVVALQANSLKLDEFLETRFELLCGILDAQLQAAAEEIRGSVRAPGALERLARKIRPQP
jgi:chromosome segregation ATPase